MLSSILTSFSPLDMPPPPTWIQTEPVNIPHQAFGTGLAQRPPLCMHTIAASWPPCAITDKSGKIVGNSCAKQLYLLQTILAQSQKALKELDEAKLGLNMARIDYKKVLTFLRYGMAYPRGLRKFSDEDVNRFNSHNANVRLTDATPDKPLDERDERMRQGRPEIGRMTDQGMDEGRWGWESEFWDRSQGEGLSGGANFL